MVLKDSDYQLNNRYTAFAKAEQKPTSITYNCSLRSSNFFFLPI
ncbi:hypothetical protein DDD_0792 [Nonlabens dokdonensis DSW-6]|uniref:Uncharacterized protein n=1 Tax=Nonlabens dokdonensis (strain DSM 17205 / KCTC 12402 / DSW-6) TaxID=592029 RepID=L7W722_NONDD|nr:hypothetical protein DDD_0792 [Nonlabens dokdonensis DSW-6]